MTSINIFISSNYTIRSHAFVVLLVLVMIAWGYYLVIASYTAFSEKDPLDADLNNILSNYVLLSN